MSTRYEELNVLKATRKTHGSSDFEVVKLVPPIIKTSVTSKDEIAITSTSNAAPKKASHTTTATTVHSPPTSKVPANPAGKSHLKYQDFTNDKRSQDWSLDIPSSTTNTKTTTPIFTSTTPRPRPTTDLRATAKPTRISKPKPRFFEPKPLHEPRASKLEPSPFNKRKERILDSVTRLRRERPTYQHQELAGWVRLQRRRVPRDVVPEGLVVRPMRLVFPGWERRKVGGNYGDGDGDGEGCEQGGMNTEGGKCGVEEGLTCLWQRRAFEEA